MGHGFNLNSSDTTCGGVYRAWRPSKSKKDEKNNFPQTPLRPPTALYTHFQDLTWITFKLAVVLRSFCAPHILCTKTLFFDFFLHFFPTLTAYTGRNKQDTIKSWMCFLFPLTLSSKWAIPEHRSFIKFSDFDSLPITMRPISPRVVTPWGAEWVHSTRVGHGFNLNSQDTTCGGVLRAWRPLKSEKILKKRHFDYFYHFGNFIFLIKIKRNDIEKWLYVEFFDNPLSNIKK